MGSTPSATTGRGLGLLVLPPFLVAAWAAFGPFVTDPAILFSGVAFDLRSARLPGFGTIDPNAGFTSFALGVRAAHDLLSGALPLWNHYEGLGAPLLGEMQSAALFPPTLLLLLPHGQAIEHAVLQAVAGIGTALFLRRFGLGHTAALAGGLLYEFNGVFAWLRNAIFNPVAFLPWLFLASESLFVAARAGEPFLRRLPAIAIGALAAALALYAGFPEVVFFYSLFLLAWTASRIAALPARQAPRFLGDLLLLAALAALISAPLLIAFADYLPEAEVGDHTAAGFRDAVLPPEGLILYLTPYIYGPIFAAPQETIARIWGAIGGYLGVMPVLLGAAGLACIWRRPICWLLAAWIVICVGASHGLPLIHRTFTALPLVSIAAYSRHLNAGWIFCGVVLSACAIDLLPTLAPAARRRAGTIAGAAFLALLAAALWAAWPILQSLSQARSQRIFLVGSLATAALLTIGFGFAVRFSRAPGRVLAGLAVAEAILAFMLPFASDPTAGRLDRKLIAFLAGNLGQQRLAIASGVGLSPNFGSAFGIPALNYNDLPVPTRTVAFVRAALDPVANPLIFVPDVTDEDHSDPDRPRTLFARHLQAYAAAGVRYFLTDRDLLVRPAYPAVGQPTPLPLSAGQSVVVDIARPPETISVSGILITIGTYASASDGTLRVRLCQADRCREASAPLIGAKDDSPFRIMFDTPIELAGESAYRLLIAKEGGTHPVALWTRLALPGTATLAGAGAPPGSVPELNLIGPSTTPTVLETPTSSVFEIQGARPYASAPGCQVEARGWDRIVAQCPAPSRLLRLELFMHGWTARVNGAPTEIVPVEDTFQGLKLPAGTSSVDFAYDPLGVRPSVPIALLALLFCLGTLGAAALSRRR